MNRRCEADFRSFALNGTLMLHALSERGRRWLRNTVVQGIAVRGTGYFAVATESEWMTALVDQVKAAGLTVDAGPPSHDQARRPGKR
jgi:hypothetical protein